MTVQSISVCLFVRVFALHTQLSRAERSGKHQAGSRGLAAGLEKKRKEKKTLGDCNYFRMCGE